MLRPCLESDEDSFERLSLFADPSSAIVGGLVSGLFGSSKLSGGGGGGGGSSWATERAVLRLADSPNGPAIVAEMVPDRSGRRPPPMCRSWRWWAGGGTSGAVLYAGSNEEGAGATRC